MDPQQRMSLEVTWEALENAGIPAKDLSGSNTAVFWGINSDDHAKLVLEDIPNIEAWMGIGTAYCGVPNRISYHLNLVGPSSAVDAACASSLVAIHHGVQSIILGESNTAIVGGANAMCGPGLTRVLDKAGAISSEGCCRSFDDEASGYGRGEGAASIILKNVSQAIQDGDHIQAIIKGSAVAHDGKKNGIMAPNGKAQQLVARNALNVGDISPLSVQYIEAHATSTPLGDPTEVSALAGVYGVGRKEDDPCFIGSVKPNIGHLEAGAGAMGFIKAVMAVDKGILAPQANLKTPNSRVDWENAGLKLVQEITKWPETNKTRRAAVSSYGYGGTVSHAVIEQFSLPSPPLDTIRSAQSMGPVLLLLSGPQEKRLPLQARTLKDWLQSDAGRKEKLDAIATTLAVRRDHHDYRATMVVDSHEDAIKVLGDLVEGSNHPWLSQSRVFGSDVRKDVVWVFSGHGAQWSGMGKQMLHNQIFVETINPLDTIVQAEIGLSPIALLQGGELGASDEVQILTYIMQIGISAVLNHKGVFPQAIIGHSVGEIAASAIAGAISVDDGARIVTRRARLYREVMGQGGMILVSKPYAEISQELNGRTDLVAAIDTSPSSCVVAGVKTAVEEAAEAFKERGVKTFTVRTDIAFHSPMLDQLIEPLLATLGDLVPKSPCTKLYSTSLLDPRGQDARGPEYWTNNMVNPVRLVPAVKAAVEDGYRVFLEVSSHPIVSHSISETVSDIGVEDYSVVPTLQRKKPSDKSILHAIAQLHCCGAEIDWKTQLPGPWSRGLPTTTWMHRPAWRKIEAGQFNTGLTHDVEKHTLLGQRIDVAGTDTVVYATHLDNDTKPFPGSHPLHGTEIIPAAGLINTFLKGTAAKVLQNVMLRVPVAISAPRAVQVVVQQEEIKIMSQLVQNKDDSPTDNALWVTHTTAQWNNESTQTSDIDIDAVKARIGTRLRDDFTIDYLSKVGVSAMGFPWAIKEHYGNTKEMIARVDSAPEVAPGAALPWDASSWAPILDAATSVGSTIFMDDPRLRMPAHIQKVEIFTRENPPKTAWLYVEKASNTALASHVSVCSDAGEVVAKFTSMRFSEIEGTPGVSGSMESLVHQIAWPPAKPMEDPLPISHVVFVCNNLDLREKYAQTLPAEVQTLMVDSSKDLAAQASGLPLTKETVIVYIPDEVQSLQEVPQASENLMWGLLENIKFIVRESVVSKLFVLTLNTAEGDSPTALAHGALIGLSRVLASEHSDQFGGLIDTEAPVFPLSTLRYIQDSDIIRIRDGVARIARFRSLPRNQLRPASQISLLPRANGTYLITGGLGVLGLSVSEFLVEKGARRLILISGRSLPPRKTWGSIEGELAETISRVQALENRGATMYVLSLDMSAHDSAYQLSSALDRLSLPPILGVVHAAGVLDDQLAIETTKDAISRVLAPKIQGALALHEVFPPKSLDFFMLFSSCGQHIGITGQSSYASGNSFLDTLATHRHCQGDTAIAIQWTSWRGMGMSVNTGFVNAELEIKGITDVTHEDAFRAWQHLAKYDTDHGVVLRSLAFDEGEPLPTPILSDIAVRKVSQASSVDSGETNGDSGATPIPTSGPELKTYIDERIRGCIANVLHMGAEDVDSRAALSDLGIDSVMTASLRREMQKTLKVKVPPTLTWSYPTVGHLVGWFAEKVGN